MRRTERAALGQPPWSPASGAGAAWLRAASRVSATVAVVAVPRLADACAVCVGGSESDWPAAFLLGTVLLLGLPPAIVVAAGIAIRRAMRRQELHEAALGPLATAGPEGGAARADGVVHAGAPSLM